MGFEFGLSKQMKKKEASIVQKNPLILTDIKSSHNMIVCIFDTFYPKSLVTSIKKWININLPDFSVVGITATTLDIVGEDLKGVVDFYTRNKIDFDKVLEPFKSYNKVYIPFGRAIYAITQSDDISVEDFYDFIFNPTYFFSPDLRGYCFPVDHPFALFKNMNGSFVPCDASRTHFAEFQLKKIKSRFSQLISDIEVPEIGLIDLDTQEKVDNFIQEYKDYEGEVAFDIETDSLNFMEGNIGCITLAFNENEGYFIPIEFIDLKTFVDFMSNKKVVGQNLKFDNKFIKKFAKKIFKVYSDTYILSQTLCEFRGNSLKALAWYYTKHGGYDRTLDTFKKKYNVNNYLSIPHSILKLYAIMDAVVTFQAHKKMQLQLSWIDETFLPKPGEKTVRYFYEEKVMPSYREFIEIEYEGMHVNTENHEKLTLKILEDIKAEKDKIYKLFNTSEAELNLDSSKQLGKFIEYNLGWKDYGRGKTKEYSTGDDQIVRWIKDGNAGAKELQKYRSLATLLKTFMGLPRTKEGWREYFQVHEDGTVRVHANFGIGNAESKRNTCSNPNLQQMPAHGAYAKEFKKLVSVPPPIGDDDFLLGTLDYASLQIRLCALNSMDPVLCNIYKTDSNPDLHSTTGYSLVKANEFNFIKLTLDNGEVLDLYELQPIMVNRLNEEICINTIDIQPTDIFLRIGDK